jgi:hypothetical protein
MRSVLTQNPMKLASVTARAAIMHPSEPMTAPSMNPARLPMRAIRRAAGTDAIAVPTTIMAMGSVAREGDGASSPPTIPPTRITSGATASPMI